MTHHDEIESQPSAPMCDRLSPRMLAAVAQYFRAMAHPTRLGIVLELAERRQIVRQLAETLRLSEPSVSRHLAILRHAGITTSQRRGTCVLNALVDNTAVRACQLAGRGRGTEPEQRP